jgi:hypothetical protein
LGIFDTFSSPTLLLSKFSKASSRKIAPHKAPLHAFVSRGPLIVIQDRSAVSRNLPSPSPISFTVNGSVFVIS